MSSLSVLNVALNYQNTKPTLNQIGGDTPQASIDKTNDAEKYTTKYPGDSPNGGFTAEGSSKTLPKSLFYEYTEGEYGASSGLFNYYLLGTNVGSPLASGGNKKSFSLSGSENFPNNNLVSNDLSRNPTAYNIVKVTTIDGGYLNPSSPYIGQPYNPKDFIFCKDYGKVLNNRMITLRRFPTPVFDNLKIPVSAQYPTSTNGKVTPVDFSGFSKKDLAKKQINVPLCQAVGFFGEGTGNDLNSIIGFSTGLNWKSRTQDKRIDYTKNDPGFYSGFGDVFNSIFNQSINQGLDAVSNVGGALLEPQNIQKLYTRGLFNNLTQTGNPLSERIFVDINTVNRMWVREVGLSGGDADFNLTFKYDLTSVSDINSRILFMDLFANLMSLGTDYGKFLTPQILENPITRGFGFPGGAEGYKNYVTDPVRWISKLIQNSHSEAAAAKSKEYQLKINKLKAEFLQFKQSGEINPDGQLYKSLTLLLTEKMLDKIVYDPLMVSGYPTGDWHIVVGNPLNPIAMIGNLICKNVKITFDSELGPDDFPTGMTAIYTMGHARQRHRGELESMFNKGHGRLYLGEFAETNATQGFVTVKGDNPDTADLKDLRKTVSQYFSTGLSSQK